MAVRLFEGIRPLSRRGAARDALAGITLASMNIPQVLGYTRIAGTPVVTGLYTVLLPLVAFAVFGSSRHLVVAADSATAAIFAGGLSRMASAGSERYMALVGIVALLTAAMLLLARVFKLGFLADFLSRTVLVGFLAGVGIQVGIAMLPDMTGLAVNSHRAVQQLAELARGAAGIRGPTAVLAAAVVAIILIGHRYAPRIPVPMLVVLGAIGASFMWDFEARGIAVIGPVPSGLPSIGLPDVSWGDVLLLLPIAASCFVMIMAQSAVAARAFAIRHGERVDADADILGLAMANAAAGVSGAFVVNGSPTQTAMAERAGARSQLAQVVFAGVVALVLLFATGPLQFLPRCVLAAVVFTIAVGLVDLAATRGHPSRKSRRVCAGGRHRGGGRVDRRRAGDPAGDCVVAAAARTPQLSAAHDAACTGHSRSVGSEGRPSRNADRARLDRLPFRRRPVLRERSAIRR